MKREEKNRVTIIVNQEDFLSDFEDCAVSCDTVSVCECTLKHTCVLDDGSEIEDVTTRHFKC